VQNTGFSTNKTLNIHGRLMNLDTPKVMGILNVTPDSFYDGGQFNSPSASLHQAEKMIAEGVDIIDVGGYSTRPGAAEVDKPEEIRRVVETIRNIKKHFPDMAISVDTFRGEVARAAVNEGAALINDVSGGELDPDMFGIVADLKVPYIFMHMRGTPGTMVKLNQYDNLMKEIIDYFHKKISALTELGVKDLLVDPGFGFAKSREQNFELLNRLEELKVLNKPILVGLSRKSLVWKTLDIQPADALNGTSALHAIALLKGAHMLRVHDVKACVEVIKLINALKQSTV
jgi:dihydropteroate synthase